MAGGGQGGGGMGGGQGGDMGGPVSGTMGGAGGDLGTASYLNKGGFDGGYGMGSPFGGYGGGMGGFGGGYGMGSPFGGFSMGMPMYGGYGMGSPFGGFGGMPMYGGYGGGMGGYGGYGGYGGFGGMPMYGGFGGGMGGFDGGMKGGFSRGMGSPFRGGMGGIQDRVYRGEPGMAYAGGSPGFYSNPQTRSDPGFDFRPGESGQYGGITPGGRFKGPAVLPPEFQPSVPELTVQPAVQPAPDFMTNQPLETTGQPKSDYDFRTLDRFNRPTSAQDAYNQTIAMGMSPEYRNIYYALNPATRSYGMHAPATGPNDPNWQYLAGQARHSYNTFGPGGGFSTTPRPEAAPPAEAPAAGVPKPLIIPTAAPAAPQAPAKLPGLSGFNSLLQQLQQKPLTKPLVIPADSSAAPQIPIAPTMPEAPAIDSRGTVETKDNVPEGVPKPGMVAYRPYIPDTGVMGRPWQDPAVARPGEYAAPTPGGDRPSPVKPPWSYGSAQEAYDQTLAGYLNPNYEQYYLSFAPSTRAYLQKPPSRAEAEALAERARQSWTENRGKDPWARRTGGIVSLLKRK